METLTDRSIISFCITGSTGCAVFGDKRLKCWGQMYGWGFSSDNQLKLGGTPSEIGDGLPYVNIGTSLGAEKVTCGGSFVCVKLNTKRMKCLGWNNSGQMGIGTSTDPIGFATGYIGDALPEVNLGTDIDVFDVAAGGTLSCAIVTGNRLKCYGGNRDGQLGLGDTSDRGFSLNDMGDNLPFVDLGTGAEVSTLFIGPNSYHSCVILSQPAQYDQRMKCWGSNSHRQLGLGDDSHRGDNPNEMGDNLPLIDLGTESRVKQVAIGGLHTCAILVNAALKCWGYGEHGELASGATDVVYSTGDSLLAISPDIGNKFALVTAGYYHTCVVYDDQVTMKCVGLNDSGQLGQGDTINRGNTPTTMLTSIPAIQLGTGSLSISSIYAGWSHTCVVFIDRNVKCFGWNGFAQALIGSTSNIGDGPDEMGNFLQFSQFFSPTQSPTTQTPSTSVSTTQIPSTSVPTTQSPPTRIPTTSVTRFAPTTRTPTTSSSETSTKNETVLISLASVFGCLLAFGVCFFFVSKRRRSTNQQHLETNEGYRIKDMPIEDAYIVENEMHMDLSSIPTAVPIREYGQS